MVPDDLVKKYTGTLFCPRCQSRDFLRLSNRESRFTGGHCLDCGEISREECDAADQPREP